MTGICAELHPQFGAAGQSHEVALVVIAHIAFALIARAQAEYTFHLELSFEESSKSLPHADDTTWTGARLRGEAAITATSDPAPREAGQRVAEGLGPAHWLPLRATRSGEPADGALRNRRAVVRGTGGPFVLLACCAKRAHKGRCCEDTARLLVIPAIKLPTQLVIPSRSSRWSGMASVTMSKDSVIVASPSIGVVPENPPTR